MSRAGDVLRGLHWRNGMASIGEWQFEIQTPDQEDWTKRQDRFLLYKTPGLLEQYARFWDDRPRFAPKHIVELGIWDGGSTVLYCEMFGPSKLVAIDDASRGDSPYFMAYVERKQLQDRVSTHWGVDQSDRATVAGLIDEQFTSPLDLVIDDASHQYEDALASFEVLFPRLREGGLYVIEDWARALLSDPEGTDPHRARASSSRHVNQAEYSGRAPLHVLVTELVISTGRSWIVSSLHIQQGFCAVTRGEPTWEDKQFDLRSLVSLDQ